MAVFWLLVWTCNYRLFFTAEVEIKEHPMGEAGRDALRVGFDRTVKLQLHGPTASSDAGLFPFRDLDDAAQPRAGGIRLIRLIFGHNARESLVSRRETQKAHSGKASNLIQARVRLAL